MNKVAITILSICVSICSLKGQTLQSVTNSGNSTTRSVWIGMDSAAGVTGGVIQNTLNVGGKMKLIGIASSYTSGADANQPTIYRSGVNTGSYPYNNYDNLIFQAGIQARDILMVTGSTPTARLIVSGNGNVGIGTTTPQTTLDVIGTVKGYMINMSEPSGYIGFLGRGASYTGGWSATPDILALTYFQRDFAIGGWRKSDGLWNGASLYINSDNGYTGIGTTSPDTKMHVVGDVKSTNGTIKTILGSTSGSIGYAGTFSNNNFCLFSNSLQQMTILTNGNVLVGKTSQTNSAYKLDVGGSIRADKVVVNTTGADFVFDSSYQLPSLNEVEDFIAANKHLPGIASASQMQQDGLDVGEHQTKLLQKTEELTLYIIEQNKMLANQSKLIEELRQELQVQKNELKQLKNNIKQNQ